MLSNADGVPPEKPTTSVSTPSAAARDDVAVVADSSLTADRFERLADHAHQLAFDGRRRNSLDPLSVAPQLVAPDMGAIVEIHGLFSPPQPSLSRLHLGFAAGAPFVAESGGDDLVQARIQTRIDLGGLQSARHSRRA